MSTPKLELVGLKKEFADGSVAAVDGIDLAVEEGQTLALLGPSGCGKSTTLNMIVGLEQPSSGDIRIDGRSVVAVPPGRRNVGLVFQDYAVFTSMSVRENLAFGLRVRGQRKAEIDRAVGEVAELLGLSTMLNGNARDLGGSELQRVAIGRTLVTRPAILLLDEPLSNLEAGTRLATRRELRRLQKEAGLTIIYVTHDQVEALSLADWIAVMSAGKIRQVAPASLICQQPDNIFVASFMGTPPMNLLRGALTRADGGYVFRKDAFVVGLLPGTDIGEAADLPVTIGIRPEEVRLCASGEAGLPARVLLAEPRGSETVVTLETGGQVIKAVIASDHRPTEGRDVMLEIDAASLVLFSGETNRRLPMIAELRA
ncbi:ABC transporter ATP-binding protein [Bradyrhizobium uaiense]|uniref:ABC transporter ATP-binding protein n=1 Tax=Bradyrhizobium uaiense TaxID=2594946 RepID=A0A6P1BN12_9BRAD|nr:ABC transporter ATP-binding protein [Bradyrhizobium uaiense]NEU99593.1 ABC transporter ATP-binding protein [Bradyrhizobium uaiense]